jgi:hypothetical protein
MQQNIALIWGKSLVSHMALDQRSSPLLPLLEGDQVMEKEKPLTKRDATADRQHGGQERSLVRKQGENLKSIHPGLYPYIVTVYIC